MQQYLELRKKTETAQGSIYTFSRNGQTVTLLESDALKVIELYPSSARNCRIINGVISLKQGQLSVMHEPIKKQNTVYIYTSWENTKNKIRIVANDLAFNDISGDEAFLKKHTDVIKAIDRATIVDYRLETIITPYGTCGIDRLSTGLKTLLNIYYCLQYPQKEFIINIDECGENVLHYIFSAVTGSNVALHLSHTVFYMPDEYTYVVNGRQLKDPLEFFEILLGDDL